MAKFSKIIGAKVRLNEVYEKKDSEELGVVNSIDLYCIVPEPEKGFIGMNIKKYSLRPEEIPYIFDIKESFIKALDDTYDDKYIRSLIEKIINLDCIIQSKSRSYNNIVSDYITELFFVSPPDIKGYEKRKE